jgi:hypothetical protein
MKKTLRLLSIVTLGTMTYIMFGGSCLPKTIIPVNGLLFNKVFKTTVDDSLASKMLTNPTDRGVLNLFEIYKDKKNDTETLTEITRKYSADVATLYYLQRIYQSEINRDAQDLYLTYFENQSTNAPQNEFDKLKEYIVVFVPGLAYKEDTTTGADFARQRRLLISKGIKNELIEVGEWDLAEENAKKVAKRLKIISEQNEKIILVSASKGSLETAIALGKILKPEETKSIKSWINVGGILRGSPIADNYLKFPKCWLAKIMLWTKGKKINIVQDMSYKSRKESFSQLQFPKNIKIISFVGAPLATKINKEIKSRYCSMIGLGPNDGLTPLADETIENGMIVSEIGLDHYFRDENIDKKTLALALVAVKIQD